MRGPQHFCRRRPRSLSLIIISFNTQTGLLLTNAVLILNRRRFLSKYGLDDLQSVQATRNPMVAQAGGLLHAVQYLKVPVIVCNIITIFFEILLGS